MGSAAIQFYGADSVLKAAENRDCPNWAIFQNKQFLFKYEGGDQNESSQFLNEILQSLTNAGSTAMYTICFYEDADKIKANTPHDGSFNFRLISEDQRQQRNEMYTSANQAILNKLDALEQRLAMMEEEEEEEEGEEEELGGIGGMVIGLLKEPDKLAQLITIGKNLLGISTNNLQTRPAAMAGIDVTSQDAEKLHLAIERLKKADPKITEHLEKLAGIAENDPATFKYLIGMLDKF